MNMTKKAATTMMPELNAVSRRTPNARPLGCGFLIGWTVASLTNYNANWESFDQ